DVLRLVDVAGGDRLAGARARVGAALVGRDRVDADVEAELGPEAAEEGEVAGALGPEAEVFADDDEAGQELLGDELAGEALGLPGGEGGVEAADVHAVDAEVAEEPGAVLERRQAGRRAGPHDRAGVRVEGEDAGG